MFNGIKSFCKVITGRHEPTMEEVTQKPKLDAISHFNNTDFELLKMQSKTNLYSCPVIIENFEGSSAQIQWIKDGVIITAK